MMPRRSPTSMLLTVAAAVAMAHPFAAAEPGRPPPEPLAVLRTAEGTNVVTGRDPVERSAHARQLDRSRPAPRPHLRRPLRPEDPRRPRPLDRRPHRDQRRAARLPAEPRRAQARHDAHPV